MLINIEQHQHCLGCSANLLCFVQVVVAISAAAQSTLPDNIKKKLAMAHLAVATALQAFTLVASNTQARHTSSAPTLELFVHMVAKLMHHVLRPPGTSIPTASAKAAEEVCIQELNVMASCCEAVASVASKGKVPGLQQLPGEELLLNLSQRRESQHKIQVPLIFIASLQHGNIVVLLSLAC